MRCPGGQVVGRCWYVRVDGNRLKRGGARVTESVRWSLLLLPASFPLFEYQDSFSLPAPAALAQWLVFMAGGAWGVVFWACNHWRVGERSSGRGRGKMPTGPGGESRVREVLKDKTPNGTTLSIWISPLLSCPVLASWVASSPPPGADARGLGEGPRELPASGSSFSKVLGAGRWALDRPGEVPTRSETRAECGDSSANTDTCPLWEPPSGTKFRELGGLRAANLPRVPDISDPASKPPDWCG